MLAAALGLCCVLSGPCAQAGAGDALEVKAKVLTMRSAANRKSDPRAWLKRGHRLTEVAREGVWVQVTTGLPGVKANGWVHSRHVTPASPDDSSSADSGSAEPPAQTATAPAETPLAEPPPVAAVETPPEPEPEPKPAPVETAPTQPEPTAPAPTETATAPAPETDTEPATQAVATAAPEPPPQDTISDAKKSRAAFEAFYDEYRKLTARYRALSDGKDLFLSAVDRGNGRLELTATDYWFTGTDKDRENDVATVMRLWREVQDTKAMIVVVDEAGQEQMRMFEQL